MLSGNSASRGTCHPLGAYKWALGGSFYIYNGAKVRGGSSSEMRESGKIQTVERERRGREKGNKY